jgi:proteasome lid subunit RPN8/RPN11
MDADSAHSGSKISQSLSGIFLPERIFFEIHSHASSIFPEECCGLLLGVFEEIKLKRVEESKRMGNVFQKEERYHRYTIDPKEFMIAETDAEARGLEVVGIYHSHPNAEAVPSNFDRDHAWPTLSYVVVEVRASKPANTRSWILKDDRTGFTEEKITIGN